VSREAVIVEAARTPIGRGHPEKGYYKDVHPVALLAHVYTELIARTGIDAAEVDKVICGCAQQVGEQMHDIGRMGWLHAGLPIETAATTVDTACGSAQQAVNYATALVNAGVHDVVIGCGVEHMGRVSFGVAREVQERFGSPRTPELLRHHPITNQGDGAETLARRYEISRKEMDELAVRSHRLAAAATEAGSFEREIIPTEGHVTDQGIRPDTSLEALSKLKPAFQENGTVTAGNASQISDGAAAVLVMNREKAEALGLTPRAKIVAQTTVGVDPVVMLEGPIPATTKLLQTTGMSIGDIDAFEVNEAFAPVVLAWAREHSPDMDRVNQRGGAMALGHPLGSSGARLITTLLHTLEDNDEETGLVTMCCAGGLGTGSVLQRI
jgi:acetyl-CoA acetyltransferase family protein